MKITLKLILSLAATVCGVAFVSATLQTGLSPTHPGWMRTFLRHLLPAGAGTAMTLLVVRWILAGLVRRAADWLRRLRLGSDEGAGAGLPRLRLFEPLAREVKTTVTSLFAARAAAEEEAKLRQSAESLWTPERLKEYTRLKLQDRPLLVVSNREPYTHLHKGKEIECVVPPSGLVSALEPVLRACGGTWIAHGNGDADREVVDARDRVRVPPDEPAYTLRRVWLSEEEHKGHYYGFSNEGLWPLCHIVHTRPVFRPDDWEKYRAVNERFAEVVLEEVADADEPWVLVQDYHFALLPRLIKDRRPDARVALFWHIPWPNPESFGICPWKKDLLDGMLGADLIGFHTQYHCNHFLDTVDGTLESRIDWEHFAVNRRGHTTWAKPFPISVGFNLVSSPFAATPDHPADKAALLKSLGLRASHLALGVDRIDYTKGIGERLRAVEQLLDKYPQYRGEFVFVELGAPSRTLIKRYSDLSVELTAEAERINQKFKTKDWAPILLLEKDHSHKEIERFYKAADLCLVTSLHDGMNLVAKEFVASRDDDDGVLVLSHFTGASRELRDALIVNPYDIEQVADAVHNALQMSFQERTTRMKKKREIVRDRNVYRWAADLVTELGAIRMPVSDRAAV